MAVCLKVRKNERKKKTHGRVQGAPGRAALRRGSFTAEAAIAIPLFFFCVLTLISFLEMFRLSMIHTVRLQQEAEEMGRAAGLMAGFAEEIDLYESVPWNAGFSSAFGASAGIAVRAHVRPWVGRSAQEGGSSAAQTSEQLVYVTEYQSVYHTDSRCTHLALTVQAVHAQKVEKLRNNYGARYHACEKCARAGGANTVYITPEGDHFHIDAECGALTRTVRMERLSDLSELHICSRCAAREET